MNRRAYTKTIKEAQRYLAELGLQPRDGQPVESLDPRGVMTYVVGKMRVAGFHKTQYKDTDPVMVVSVGVDDANSVGGVANSEVTLTAGWQERLKRAFANMVEVAEIYPSKVPPCPHCGAPMIDREMKREGHPHQGERYWGCAKYPACRGMVAPWRPKGDDPDVGKLAEGLRCPECGMHMVIRQCRKGANVGKKFYGCLDYPRCRGTLGRSDALAQLMMGDQEKSDDW